MGGSPGEQGAGGVRETGEERVGSGREIQKGRQLKAVVHVGLHDVYLIQKCGLFSQVLSSAG